VRDTLLETVIVRDSGFRGYLAPPDAPVLIASTVPGVIDSRPIIRFQPLGTTTRLGSDTTAYPIVATDSAFLSLRVARRDTSAGNLRINVYRMPVSIDAGTTFGDLVGPFTDSLVRSVNLDSLIALPEGRDSVTGDIVTGDSVSVQLTVHLDSAQARFLVADSGQLAYGIRIQADTATSVVIGANESADAATILWHFHVDSAGTPVALSRIVAPQFDSYVFNPPTVPVDSTLVIGGMPSARSVLRVLMPPRLQDSVQIVRASLILVPSTAAQGAPADSFMLIAHAVVTDLGAKSPLIGPASATDSTYFGAAPVLPGSTDTVRIEITRVLRRWALDSTASNTLILRSGSEGVVLTEIRFQPSRHATLHPSVRLTYTPRFPFGTP
jgi:hypothetical protein